MAVGDNKYGIRENYLKQTKPEPGAYKERHRGNPTKKYEGRGGEGKEVPGRESITKKGKNQHCMRTLACSRAPL